MHYILKISNKAFVKIEENFDLTIIENPERAIKFGRIGDAMKQASQINNDWETNAVQVLRI